MKRMNTTFWMGDTMVTVKVRDDREIVRALREIVIRKDSRYTALYNRNTEKDGD
jgi:hypothetical protein